MAMNKKEQAAMKAAIDRAELLAALRWTEEVPKDLPPPDFGDSHTSGWYANSYSTVASPAWSKRVSHGIGQPEPHPRNSASQQGICLYSTKLRALQALRHTVELECAKKLLHIDKQIAKEKSPD